MVGLRFFVKCIGRSILTKVALIGVVGIVSLLVAPVAAESVTPPSPNQPWMPSSVAECPNFPYSVPPGYSVSKPTMTTNPFGPVEGTPANNSMTPTSPPSAVIGNAKTVCQSTVTAASSQSTDPPAYYYYLGTTDQVLGEAYYWPFQGTDSVYCDFDSYINDIDNYTQAQAGEWLYASYCNTDGGDGGLADGSVTVVNDSYQDGPRTLVPTFHYWYYSQIGGDVLEGTFSVCSQVPIGQPQYYNCIWFQAYVEGTPASPA